MLRRVYIIACVFLQDRKDERRRVWAFDGWNLDLRQFAWSPSSLTEPHLIFHRGFPSFYLVLFCFHFFWKMSTIERKGLVRIFRGYEHNGMTSKCSLRGWTRRNTYGDKNSFGHLPCIRSVPPRRGRGSWMTKQFILSAVAARQPSLAGGKYVRRTYSNFKVLS